MTTILRHDDLYLCLLDIDRNTAELLAVKFSSEISVQFELSVRDYIPACSVSTKSCRDLFPGFLEIWLL